MKKVLYSIALMMVAVFSSVLLTACGDPEPTKLEIVATSVENPTLVNQPHDLSGLKVVVTYDNGDKKTVDKNNDMTITPINVNQLGEQTLTVKYLGLTATLKVEVVATEGDLYSILGFNKPKFQTDWAFARLQHTDNSATADFDETELNFVDRTQSYKVGDENPFIYLPIITALNDEGDDIELGAYTSKVTVELKEGSTYTKLEGAALEAAVEVDNTKSSFDFKQAAVGKTYRITVEPANNPNEVPELSIEVEVVDGFNVHNIAELSAMDNNQRAVDDWAEYKAAHGITQTAQDGIVLHGNLEVTANDIPKSYIYNYNENGDNLDGATAENDGTLKYKKTIYCRDAQTPFTVYGNYFTVDTHKIPYSVDYPDAEFGHTYIFGFGGDDEECPGTKQAACRVESIYMIGNSNKDDSTQLRGGNNGIISSSENLVINNMVSRAFLTHFSTVDSVACSYSGAMYNYDVKTTIQNSNMYDSYSMMGFAWGDVEVEINDCTFKRAGGPTVMATQVVERHEVTEGEGEGATTREEIDNIRAPKVTVNGGTTQSYLAGTEGWFDLTPGAADAVRGQILPLSVSIHQATTLLAAQLNPMFEGMGAPLVMPVKKLTTNDGGLDKLNLVSLLLSNADNPIASPYGLESEFIIAGATPEAPKCYNDPLDKIAPVYAALKSVFGAAPFFEANGVVMTTDMSTFYVVKDGNVYNIQTPADVQVVAEDIVKFFSADYMNLYMGGTGLACTLEMFAADAYQFPA